MRSIKYIGIDIGKRNCYVCVMDEKKNVREETHYANLYGEAFKYATKAKARYGQCKAVCESTGNLWVRTANAFEKADIPIQLSNPFKTGLIAKAGVKTDKIDVKVLAGLLRSDMLATCHIGTAEERGNKQLFRYQMGLMRDRTGVINSTHSLLDKYDVDPKKGGRAIWRPKTLAYLDTIRLADHADQFVLDGHLSKIRHCNGEIGKANEKIREYAKSSYAVKLLLSLTGIDVFAAAFLASEICDIRRFKSAQSLVSWAGMCPTVHQSGDSLYHGRMKKDANRKVNWIMIQRALSAATHDPKMVAHYERIKKRHPPQVAITHVAKKMLVIIWTMLTRNETYESRDKKLHAAKLRKLMK